MYDELYKAWLKEKEREDLQPLPRDFYSRLAAYMKRIEEESRMLDKRTVKGRAMLREEENAKRLIEDLARMRLEKIVRAVMNDEVVSTTVLSEEETSLYENLASEIESYRSLVRKVLRGQRPEARRITSKKGMVVVRILKDVPAIVGADMKTYGPFKPEDVAALPRENAKLLIKQGVAMEIESAQ